MGIVYELVFEDKNGVCDFAFNEIKNFLEICIKDERKFDILSRQKLLKSFIPKNDFRLLSIVISVLSSHLIRSLRFQDQNSPNKNDENFANENIETLTKIKDKKQNLTKNVTNILDEIENNKKLNQKISQIKISQNNENLVIYPIFPLLPKERIKKEFEKMVKETNLEELKKMIEYSFGYAHHLYCNNQNDQISFKTDKTDFSNLVKFLDLVDFDSFKKIEEIEENEKIGEHERKLAIWIFVKLHKLVNNKNDPNLLKTLELINHCLKKETIFNQKVLTEAVNKIMQGKETSILLMRTLIQIYLLYPGTIDLVKTVLTQLLRRKIWQSPSVWEGFVKCLAWTLPESMSVLTKLDSDLIKTAFKNDETFRTKLKEAFKKDGSLLFSLPSSLRRFLLSKDTMKRKSESYRKKRKK
ncbi:hypothetical protein MHBO_002498 [Bonamia ostreae]|uniref:Symplekin C-terminal domain-containing protein n=1 Tax=Bonamia ostreae TaxID=126728 RepID=A0ABV2AMH6_9EUKA